MTELEILREALQRIKKKSEMWQQAAQSTGGTKAVPPWWNLGDIAASALKRAEAVKADPSKECGECGATLSNHFSGCSHFPD